MSTDNIGIVRTLFCFEFRGRWAWWQFRWLFFRCLHIRKFLLVEGMIRTAESVGLVVPGKAGLAEPFVAGKALEFWLLGRHVERELRRCQVMIESR